MKEYGMNQNYLKEFYDSRKKFNKCVTDFLGKDAFLHEISHNSSSSSNSGHTYDFLSKQKNTLHSDLIQKNHIFNDYSERDPLHQQSSPLSSNIHKRVSDYNLTTEKREKIELFDRIKQQIMNYFTKNFIKFEDFNDGDLVDRFLEEIKLMENERNIRKMEGQRRSSDFIEKNEEIFRNGDIIVEIQSDLSSFYNMEIDEIKQQFDSLKQKNHQLQQQLNNYYKHSSNSQQNKQLDFLKKLTKIREQQISQLKQSSIKAQVQKQILEQKLEKYHKLVALAKVLIDDFVDKIRKYQYWKSQYYAGSRQERVQYEKGSIEKISFRNRRFQFIRAKSEEKDIRRNIKHKDTKNR